MARPLLSGIHHVKIPVLDLKPTVDWYRRVFGFQVTTEFAEADGSVLGVAGTVPGLGSALLTFRENVMACNGCKGFDPISFGLDDLAAVQMWAAWLDELKISHSPIIEASDGWLLVFDDPNGLALHLYTWASHGKDHSALPGYGHPVSRPGEAASSER